MSPSIWARAAYLACCSAVIALPAFAGENDGVALELGEAQALALNHQPLLEAQEAAVEAARNSAVAAAQLPDPRLTAGVSDVPVQGVDRYSLRRDDFTTVNVGLMQDFPRGEKRRVMGQRAGHEAEMAAQMVDSTRLTIQRDVALAWLEVWKPDRELELAHASLREAELQVKITEIAYTSGRASQAELLAARVALGLLRDDIAGLEQEVAVARSKLARWIGADEAQRLLCPDLPDWTAPAPLEDMLAHLRHHPHLDAGTQRVAIAGDDVELARQAYRPDWSAELGYGYRPDFADYVSLNFTVDLPLLTGKRQDRGLEARLAEQTQAERNQEDAYRQHEAELRADYVAWQRTQKRVLDFDQAVLPQSEQRVSAALAAWQAGQGTLASVLDARRMALDNRSKRIALAADAARDRISLQYFAGEQP